jgi:hypothetical protein
MKDLALRLCVSVVNIPWKALTTETQRIAPQRKI